MPSISRKNGTSDSGPGRRPDGGNTAAKAQPRRMLSNRNYADSGIVIVTVIMVCFGLVMLFSASMTESISEDSGAAFYVMRQLGANLLAIVIVLIMNRFNLKMLDSPQIALFAYFLTIFLLFLTYFAAPINGASRWLPLPFVGSFQPSELAKITTVYVIACYHSDLNRKRSAGKFPRLPGLKGAFVDAWHDLLKPMLIIAVIMGFVLFQPHFSGALIIFTFAGISLIAAGVPLRSWVVTILIGLLTLGILLGLFSAVRPFVPKQYENLFAHVETRLSIFQNEDTVSDAEIYQTRQSLIAIGSGGLTGVGIGQGKQKNNYLPEGHNDYIFSNIVEETGMIGGMAVMSLFLIFFILGLRVTFKAKSLFAQIIAGGITSIITLQALLNIAVNVRAIPPTGISLPFFSYGGTSNLIFLVAVGLLLNVSKFSVNRGEETVGKEG